jgi:hypothetical protein
VSVVLAKLGRGQTGHLAGLDVETGGFEPSEDRSAKAALHAVGLENDEGLFHKEPFGLKGRKLFAF